LCPETAPKSPGRCCLCTAGARPTSPSTFPDTGPVPGSVVPSLTPATVQAAAAQRHCSYVSVVPQGLAADHMMQATNQTSAAAAAAAAGSKPAGMSMAYSNTSSAPATGHQVGGVLPP
jgi:hypothetical protein